MEVIIFPWFSSHLKNANWCYSCISTSKWSLISIIEWFCCKEISMKICVYTGIARFEDCTNTFIVMGVSFYFYCNQQVFYHALCAVPARCQYMTLISLSYHADYCLIRKRFHLVYNALVATFPWNGTQRSSFLP